MLQFGPSDRIFDAPAQSVAELRLPAIVDAGIMNTGYGRQGIEAFDLE
jgi:hypothetical protein